MILLNKYLKNSYLMLVGAGLLIYSGFVLSGGWGPPCCSSIGQTDCSICIVDIRIPTDQIIIEKNTQISERQAIYMLKQTSCNTPKKIEEVKAMFLAPQSGVSTVDANNYKVTNLEEFKTILNKVRAYCSQ